MRFARIASLAVISLLLVVGCNQPQASAPPPDTTAVETPAPTPAQPKIKVVAANSILCDLTKQIAQDTIDLVCLIPAGQDPHEYKPTPQDAQAIETAAVVLYGGYNFEESLSKVVKNSKGKGNKVAVGELAVPKPLMVSAELAHSHGHDHDHSHDHGNEKTEKIADPHVWHNAENGIKMVEVITAQLSKAVPANAQLYQQNSQKLIAELTQLDAWIKEQIATIPPNRRKLVTTHDALGYFATAYGIPLQTALLGISTTEQATPTRIAELVEQIKSSGVPTIFIEATANPQLLNTVAKEAQVQVSPKSLLADGLAEQGQSGDTYQGMLMHNTQVIVEGLGGTFTAFKAK